MVVVVVAVVVVCVCIVCVRVCLIFDPVSQDQTMTVLFLQRHCVVLKFQDQTTTSLCGPEIFLGPDNDYLGLNSDRSLCGPRQNFVVLGLDNDQIKKLACGPRTGQRPD